MPNPAARATDHSRPRPGRGTPPVLLVIGAHRGELGFGERVAARLDPATFAVLRIPLGLSGQRPLPDELTSWRQRHGELYLQILERVQPGQQLIIDLHTGIDELRRSADVFCAAPNLLARIASAGPVDGDPVRGIQLVADTGGALADLAGVRPFPLARPDLPPLVWDRATPRYVGVEVYVACEGSGSPDDHAFAADLLRRIVACAMGDGAV
ncbi:MAG: hypothetical protein KFB96_21670 [Thiocapsa sp.]|uniref:hypothetical protein n=1 Tax=Thiocapsa sp. TaxID=2024551 RepID=UPI001BCE4211|nr:hypothetical protein [Thiocapsa sp.]QVL48205.1 MAG: hypothetical protein KFB96_21670 [Thiocapsa sp.]